MRRLEGQIAIITGSGAGIGFAIAKKFLEHGAKVLINDLHHEKLGLAKVKLI